MTEQAAAAFPRVHDLRHAGASLNKARLAVVTLHGRGASAEDILSLGAVLDLPDIAYLAPQAPGATWYPQPFTQPLDANEPFLSRSLDRIGGILEGLAGAGFGPERVALMGFSQGACLSLEFAARHIGSVAGVVAFSGGLIGPSVAGRREEGRFGGTPIFLGCSERDPYIPALRVRESAAHLQSLGADVTLRLYPEPGHSVNEDEIAHARNLLERVAGG